MLKANSLKGREDTKVAKRIEYHQLVKAFSNLENIKTVEVSKIIKDSLTNIDYQTKFIFSRDTIKGWSLKEKYCKVID